MSDVRRGGPTTDSPTSTGPVTAVAARNGVGFVSQEATLIEQTDPRGTVQVLPGSAGREVGPTDVLTWVWFPERSLPEGQTEPAVDDLDGFWAATAFALDIVFTDGTRLSDGGARDQYGDAVTPAAQDDARKQWVDQWNRRAVDLSTHAGRVVDRLEARLGRADRFTADDGLSPRADAPAAALGESVPVASDTAPDADPPAGHGRADTPTRAVRGWLDDVRIEPAGLRTGAVPPGGRPLDHVRTTRGTHSSGTFSRGNNAPLVGLPHGGVFGLPMTNASDNRWPYAYQEHNRPSDNRPAIQAFATSHLPSPWMADRGVFQVMPSPLAAPDVDRTARALGFDHVDELDGPHRYRVALDEGVTAEMTAGEFALAWRFTGTRSVVLDHHGVLRSCSVRLEDGAVVVDALLDDRPETPPHHVHLRIANAVAEHTTVVDGELRGWVEVTGDTDVLLGISTVSAEDAVANLRAAGDFTAMREHAEDRWVAELDVLQVEGATEDQLVSVYSGLYRAFLYPTRAGETALDGTPRHRSPYGDVLSEPIRDEPGPEVVDGPLTTTNGFWDTYRTAWPLLALLTPDTAADLAEGVVGHFADGGWTPRWSAPGAEDVMTGTTSDTVFADLVAKGVDGFDVEHAYRSALRNATVPARDRRVGRKGSLPGLFRGYVDTATGEGMSWTLDAAINDWGVAVLARTLAARAAADGEAAAEARYRAEHEWFARRSLQYRNVFDRERGFFIGRTPDGGWRGDFDPDVWGSDYTETNAWGTMFTAPHDGAGVVDLHGGPAAFDEAFARFSERRETGATDRSGSYGFAIHEMTEARDIRMGMLGLSNQPAHHIPFFPMFAGRHDDAHRIVRECLDRLFVGSDLGQGYPGDEDNGEMSAWYVFATVGLYPLAPSTGTYVLVPPAVRRTVLRPPGSGSPTVIETTGTGRFIGAVTVDDEPWGSISIPHAVVVGASRIVVALSETPVGWAADTRPASASEQHGYRDTPDDVLPVDASPLTDDTGLTRVALGVGESVVVPVTVAATSLVTVTAAEAGRSSWRITLRDADDRVVHQLDAQDEEFVWAGQTRVFPFAGGVRAGTLSFEAVTPVTLTQLQLVAADGSAP
ncbi:GH92 family glycosyl hydrolase [Curtobacterium sp. MCBD17_032]|uniref:GH92 family glycosyl hydrolase n=1 Tax=Curtobacterium sp. MCBD17_032 TaxID=2175659 RepID=UPI000DA87A0E|nr:GH92 family glycosyl hydrolase [Curtobacterium sp. MCBD17_032]PZE82176.1 glycoside hydrolase family 92 protein [Curtobacterium sp. MCBD17_032]